MKKLMQVLVIMVAMLFAAGCSSSIEEEKVEELKEFLVQLEEKSNLGSKPIKKPEAMDYIQSAIDYANRIAGAGLFMDTEGNFYVCGDGYTDQLVALYSCYGKDVKQIRRWGRDILSILTENGDVYHNTQLVSEGKNVTDVLWKTNNVGVNAVFLLGNGNYINYGNNYEMKTTEHSADKEAIVACRWREDLMTLDREGNYECSGEWENCEVKGWKDIVVLARTANEETKSATIAGISADGTVYATGTFAEDILSWGELAYISMDDELIVALKKNGTLVFSGEKGAMYSALDTIENVKGVRLWRGVLWAITDEGMVSSSYGHTSKPEIKSVKFELKMDKEGNIYQNTKADDGVWNWEVSDYPKADAENGEGLILYQLLLHKEEINSFVVKDLNNDGAVEIIADTVEGWQKVYANHGYLENMMEGQRIAGYYPDAGIVVVKDSGYDFSHVEYKEFPSGKVILSSMDTSSPETAGEKKYYKGTTEGIEITGEEFQKILLKHIAGEKLYEITYEDFQENIEDNLRKTFLE